MSRNVQVKRKTAVLPFGSTVIILLNRTDARTISRTVAQNEII